MWLLLFVLVVIIVIIWNWPSSEAFQEERYAQYLQMAKSHNNQIRNLDNKESIHYKRRDPLDELTGNEIYGMETNREKSLSMI